MYICVCEYASSSLSLDLSLSLSLSLLFFGWKMYGRPWKYRSAMMTLDDKMNCNDGGRFENYASKKSERRKVKRLSTR